MRKILMLAAVLAIQAHVPAHAEQPSFLDYMGGQGCTFAPASREAARAAGFQDAEIEALITRALADGTARQEREYVVLGEEVCSIRLPEITSPFSVTSPEIIAITSAVDAYAAEGRPGCFLQDPVELFDKMKAGELGPAADPINFIAAGLIAGEIGMISEVDYQILTGNCAAAADKDSNRRTQQTLIAVFGPMIRLIGKGYPCNYLSKDIFTPQQQDILLRLQGVDSKSGADRTGWSVWHMDEILIIAFAAGWYETRNGSYDGLRPPLCHYE